MLESAITFATIVQLVGAWRSERAMTKQEDMLDTEDLLAWLRQHKFDQMAFILEENGSVLTDIRDQAGTINTKLDQILSMLAGDEIKLKISPETADFLKMLKPEQVKFRINGSLAKAMLYVVDGQYHELVLETDYGSISLTACRPGKSENLTIDDDDVRMMKSDMENLAYNGIFDADWASDPVRYRVTRKLEEIVNEQIRPRIAEYEAMKSSHETGPACSNDSHQ